MAPPQPGMLYVTMQPQPALSLDQFHEWYNNEHGPTRLRLPHIFGNGLRYRATDKLEPTFLAAYDVVDMALLTTPQYTDLRANRTPREAATISQVDVVRYFFDQGSTRSVDGFVPPEDLTDADAEGRVLVYVEVTLSDAPGAEDALVRWYEEEHIGMLAKVPGWLRTRRYRTSSLDAGKPLKILTLHEYSKVNGLGGPEHKASMDTPWRTEVFDKYVANKHRRTYSLFYVFGPAPRDLLPLSKLPSSAAFVSVDTKTKTSPGASTESQAVIESYATVPHDNLEIPFRLEGNPSPDAPTIAFSNSLLTSLHMWDDVVALLKKARPEFRILRYDTRGRHNIPSPPVAASMERLADDLHALLAALRIPKLHALIGVSLGGATTLQFAFKYPGSLEKFIACDCNMAGSEKNTAAWKERIVIAEGPAAADGTPGIRALAGVTVSRWFHPQTLSEKRDITKAMVDMVAANSVEGFKYSCTALWEFDLKAAAKSCKVPGLLVAGEGDGGGALVKAMDGFKGLIGENGVPLRVVPDAGHLPMYENAGVFWETIKDFL